MSQLAQIRIVGYTAIISLHVMNLYYMDWYRKQVHTQDERLLVFKHLGNRFLTTWTLMFQITYAFFCLICDIFVLKNSRKQSYTLPKYIEETRDTVFSAIIWPSTWGVFTVFWGLFNYDRSLIFPEYIDLVVPRVSNHVIHTAIVPIVLFEVMSRPRIEPSTHFKNLSLMTVYILFYLIVLIFTYKQQNVWLYPIFGQLYGTIYFVFLVGVIYGLFFVSYVLQWHVGNMLCMQEIKKNKNKQTKKKS